MRLERPITALRIKSRAFAVLEYVALILILLWALSLMRPYIQNAVMGQYQKASETYSFGRQHLPSQTNETYNRW
ncbi:MAG: hypothetical protein HQL18_04395 [Candidatus Omnitrophica bacterium]|nr:hypothetical protein [Candidatus Omnitrophota bacterium]